jgi:hypothetical protein
MVNATLPGPVRICSKNLVSTGFDPGTVHPITCRYPGPLDPYIGTCCQSLGAIVPCGCFKELGCSIFNCLCVFYVPLHVVHDVWLGRLGCQCEIKEGRILQLPKPPAVCYKRALGWLLGSQRCVSRDVRAGSSFQLLVHTTRRSIVTKSTIKIVRQTPDE